MKTEKTIRKFIDDHGIKLIHIAKKTGIPITKVRKMLGGTQTMKADELVTICTYLGLELKDLRDDEQQADFGCFAWECE